MQPAVEAALIAAAVAVIGWYATYAYAKRKEDRTRRIELQIKYRQRQIEELYGPLSSLIKQIGNVWQVRGDILQQPFSAEQQHKIREFIWKNYFRPLHQEIASLMRTKLYLLEGGQIPASFADYLQHATQEDCQHRLRDDLYLETYAPSKKFPRRFPEEVDETLSRLLSEHQAGIDRLRHWRPATQYKVG